MKKYIHTLLLTGSLLIANAIFAGVQPPVTGIMRTTVGSPVLRGDSVEILTTASGSCADYDIKNIVSLNFDQNTDTFLMSPTSIRTKLRITRWDAAGVLISPTRTEFLEVTYDNRYNKQVIDKSSLKLENGYKVRVRIDSIFVNGTPVNVLPRFVFVESEILMTRYCQYTGAGVTLSAKDTLNTDCDAGGTIDELRINWGTVTGAEEYELEWTFVNNYGYTAGTYYPASALNVDFKNNSTRITTTSTNYRISLLYEKGYVAWRVRAVGRNYLDPDKYIYGSWSANNIETVSGLGTNEKYYNWREHEKPKNWQYSATYAEEGKKKEVVSYFDGSLHNRQSVTKVNSDKNVIVGETMYDYQGRPAINVLPTPVVFPSCSTSYNEPSLKYYKKYNTVAADSTYSKLHFDVDAGDPCNAGALEMDTLSGSSKYYSGNNPDKSYQQAFVPDAEGYPFSQVEYTPDNTGRIRSQSGVGPEFQIGSGHETKYIYGQPNQVQLDRLFGSEAGDASHYKKNVVIDANGQASVSYMNQEGKTIATSLAGNAPVDDSDNPILEPIASESSATDSLTIDLFNKDADGNSILNKITPLRDGLEFSTQLTVAYTSGYGFTYNLTVDSLADSCLIEDFCISCIYDLEIRVTDECGVNLLGNDSIHKMVGHLDSIPNGFTMDCDGMSDISEADSVYLTLYPGVYTVSKILTINSAARDFYVESYMDTTYNSCVKTLEDFTEEALAAIDTTLCHPTCEACAAAMGTRDDYVSSGRGTELQYDLLLEACYAPCRDLSLCAASYEMMLTDVSPGGQYGKYDVSTGGSTDALSVLNTSNALTANNTSGGLANWRYPKMILNGTIYNMYVDDLGERTKVNVIPDGANYFPPVNNLGLVYTDATTGDQYVYPENLLYTRDFLSSWNEHYANSLVMYHPEYAYYIACKDESRKMSGDTRSSEQLDSLLMHTETFADAVTNGFIKIDYDTISNHNNRVHDWFATSSSHAYDPFFTNSAFGNFYGPFPSLYTTAFPYSYNHGDVVVPMVLKFDNYLTISGVNYSMPEVAAMIARCGNNFNSTPTAACMDFGSDYYAPTDTIGNDSIRDNEWKQLKNLYISEKRKKEFQRMDFFAKHIANSPDPAMPSSDLLGGCNACVGLSSFSPYSYGFFMPFGLFSFDCPAYDGSQPCSFSNHFRFTNSAKRFIDPANTGLSASASSVPYTIYQQTGQCPMAFLLQNFLNKMANDSLLTSVPSINLNGISEFAPDLYNAIGGVVPDSGFTNYQYNLSGYNSDTLTAVIIDSTLTSNSCTLVLDIDSTPIPNFGSITALQNLSYDHTSAGMYYFKVTAIYKAGPGDLDTVNIEGRSCLNIKDCNFQPECSGNQFAYDFMNLLNIMKVTGHEKSFGYNMSADTLIEPTIGLTLKNTLGTPHTGLKWRYQSPGKYQIFDVADTTVRLLFTVLNNNSYVIDTNYMMTNIVSNYNNLFKMGALDTNNVIVATINAKAEKMAGGDTVGISMGECALPEPAECTLTEHQVRKDLEDLLNEALTVKPFDNTIDLFGHANFTSLLKTYLPYYLVSTTSAVTYDSTAEVLTFTVDSTCDFRIYHDTAATGMVFDSLIAVTDFTGVAPLDEQNSFHNFYFVALYNNNGLTVSDTVRGTSCWPIKNCDHCNDSTTVPGSYSGGPVPSTYGGWYGGGGIYQPGDSLCIFQNSPFFASTVNNYNSSIYASEHSYYLPPPTFAYFSLVGNCTTCNQSYGGYLSAYIFAGPGSTLPLPKTLLEFPGCERKNVCDSIYAAYKSVRTTYNSFVTAHPSYHYPHVDTLFSKPVFESSYCNCAQKFIAGLLDLITNPPRDSVAVFPLMDIEHSCETAPCVPLAMDTMPVFPPVPYSQDPCVAQMISAAIQAAQNDYNNYRDSITTIIASRYTEHCLQAIENFNYGYTDKEYHFTLYYYDQAGDLVKTIAPEGVEKLDVHSFMDSLSMQINSDRTHHQHTVFTNHRMPTNYDYNSLNQLVYQDMPDHDKMTLIDYTLPNGLDSRVKVYRTQFVNSAKGYLAGSLTDGTTGFERGYLYTTNNGGNNWIRVDNTVAADIHDVFFFNTTVGYAACAQGNVLLTLDGGNSWDARNFNTSSYTSDFNAVCFATATDGVFGGSEGAAAGIYLTNDGGNTFNPASGLVTGDTVTGITYDGSAYFASIKNAGEGKIYTSTDGGATWTALAMKRAGDMLKVRYLNVPAGIIGYAVGKDGTLLKTPVNTNNAWYLKATGTAKNFKDVYFRNLNEGVAIIDSVANKGQVWKTFDGGTNWELLSAPGDYYSSLQPYDSTKLFASGENGRIARVLMSSPPFGMIKLNKPSAVNDLAYADAVYYSGAPQVVAVGNNDTIYYTENANLSGVSWIKIKTTSFGMSGGDANFKKIAVKDDAGNSLKGVILTQNGKLYRFGKDTSNVFGFALAAVQDLSASTITSYFFNDLVLDSRTSTKFYAFDTISKRAFTGTINASGSPTLVFTYMDTVTAQHKGIRSIAVNSSASDFLMTGDKGIIHYKASPNSTTTNYSNRTWNVKPLPLNDIAAKAANQIYATGNDGSIWTTWNGSAWNLLNSGTSKNVNSIAVDFGGTYSGIACDSGMLYRHTMTDSTSSSLTAIDIGVTDDLTSIAMKDSNVYVSTAAGKVVHVPNITLTTYTNTIIGGMTGSLNAMAFLTGTNLAFAGGAGSAMYQCLNTNSARIHDLFLQGLSGQGFATANNGYITSVFGDIRHTTDGGTSWSVITTNASGFINMYAVKPDQAIVIGYNKYFGVVNGTTSPFTVSVGGPASIILYNLDFNQNNYGAMVGAKRATYSVVPTGSSFTVTYLGQTPLYMGSEYVLSALKVFRDNSFLTGGGFSQIYYYKGGTFTSQNSTAILPSAASKSLMDMYFHDDRTGYISGSAGTMLKCTLTGNIMESGYGDAANSIIWDTLDLNDPFHVYTAGTKSSIDIWSVDFVDRTHGFVGGQFTSGPPENYAMLIDDQSGYYSTRFWYDKLGRMVISQNTKQFNKSPQAYSYTRYDALGRISEVGEKAENTSGTSFRKVFGDYVNSFFNANTINNDSLTTWLAGGGDKTEVTRTYYDTVVFTSAPIVQENLRKRVSSVTYEDVDDNVDSTYQHATHYTYDIHGNVNTLLQDNPEISVSGQRYKQIDYEYDLISGKVNKVIYQPDAPDMFIHKYNYDADNRITQVETSTDNILWNLDAKYFYYADGPLARVEYGKNQVQGMDYAYTLQGWIKGVNSNTLNASRDMGQDGLNDTSNVNRYFAQDAMGYTLGYRDGDYKAISGLKWNSITNRFEAKTAGSDMINETHGLFNGNISHMVTALVAKDTTINGTADVSKVLPLGQIYQYDQLNRLTAALAFSNISLSSNEWLNDGLSPRKLYLNVHTYDANGNILTQVRFDDEKRIDDMTYNYKRDVNGNLMQNRLYHVNDAIGDGVFTDNDIDDQGTFDAAAATINVDNNYRYDPIGNMAADSTEEIDTILWTVYGKIKEIQRVSGSSKKNLKFDYDASGNRIAKHVLSSSNSWENSTYYSRDAQGNVMSTYKQEVIGMAMSFKLNEQDVYGSSRLGMVNPDKEMIGADTTNEFAFDTLNKRQYELSNHLGNVLTTISDRKLALDIDNDNYMDYLLADISSSTDYYPFGWALPHRLCYNDTIAEDTIYSEFFNSDIGDYTLIGSKTYTITGGEIYITPNGGMITGVSGPVITVSPGATYTIYFDANMGGCTPDAYIRIRDGMGVLVDSMSIPSSSSGPYSMEYTPAYSSFTFELVGESTLSFCSFYIDNIYVAKKGSTEFRCGAVAGNYKYGFNGKENDNEVKGDGSQQDYGMRIYDTRLGRFLSVDPLTRDYPMLTPYQFASNTPIQAIDRDGLEAYFIHGLNNPLHDVNGNKVWGTKGFAELQKTLLSYTNNKTVNTSFDWQKYADGESKGNRFMAGCDLALHVVRTHVKGEDITLIGVSHGGNVAIVAAKILSFFGYKVNIITVNTPTQSSGYEDPDKNKGINDFIQIVVKTDYVRILASDGQYDKKPEGYDRQVLQLNQKNPGVSMDEVHGTANVDTKQIENSKLKKLKPVPAKYDGK